MIACADPGVTHDELTDREDFSQESYPPEQQSEAYKQQNRNAIARIVEGNADAAIQHFSQYLQTYRADLESLYGLAVAYAQKGDIDTALDYARRAVEASLPIERFLAGPRELLRPLGESPGFQELAQERERELLHGPLLGDVTDRSARFWVRTAHEVPVQVMVSPSQDMTDPLQSDVVNSRAGDDFTAVVSVSGLQADTDYHYKLTIDGEEQPQQWSFRTFPAEGSPAAFQVGFGGGAGYTPWYERIWTTIASHHLPAFLQLGDNVYIDHPEMPAVQQYCYYRRQSRPEYRAVTASSAIFAIWDDHDFTVNDGWGGPEVETPAWKVPVWELFRDNWNNPYYGGGRSQPGCWFDFSIADVDFFMLDGRYYRTDPRTENPSMLGPVQKAWLFNRLKSSNATFKIIASDVPMASGTKPGSRDTWDGYAQEREEIFSFLEENKIDGVFIIAADRHRSDAWKIERPDGYDLYEFQSSRLTNVHTHQLMPKALFGYNEKCSFGLLTFDTARPDPEVSYQIVNIDNEVVHSLTLKLSQLSHPK